MKKRLFTSVFSFTVQDAVSVSNLQKPGKVSWWTKKRLGTNATQYTRHSLMLIECQTAGILLVHPDLEETSFI